MLEPTGRVLVKSAGNEAGWDCHASATLTAGDPQCTLEWQFGLDVMAAIENDGKKAAPTALDTLGRPPTREERVSMRFEMPDSI